MAKRAAQTICPDITCLYGATEVGVVATAPVGAIVEHEAAVGFVAPGVRVEIVDEGGSTLGCNREGIIRINVPGAPDHYLNDPDASRDVFRDGWFYPGDLGSLSEQGLLFVSGRMSERLNIGGLKVAASVLENTITQRLEIRDAAAFELVNEEGISEIAVLVVFHENFDADSLDRSEFGRWLQVKLRRLTPKHWFVAKDIPRTEQGKIDRENLRRTAKSRSDLQTAQS